MNLQLRPLRERKRLTQSEFAKEVGSTLRKVSAWERGETKLTLEDACRIADFLECTLDELAGREWPRAPAYAEPMQTELNRAYESLDDGRRKRLVEQAQDMELAKSTGSLSPMSEEAV